MSFNIKAGLLIIAAMAIGLLAGYFIFGEKNRDNVGHQHPMPAKAAAEPSAIYTCSMHPQIRQNEPGICPICEMDLIPLDANTSNDPLVLEMTEEAVKLSNIQTTLVGSKGAISKPTISLSGKIQADERRVTSQVAHVSGRIEKLYVTFTGEQVSKGQKLADLYSPDLIAVQRELLEALRLESLNPTLLEAARNKLRYWKIGESTIKSIEQSGEVEETFPLFADASGIVSNRRVAVGDHLRQGQPLFELTNLAKVWVLFDAYEAQLAYIRKGDLIEFTTPVFPQKTFKTRITFIDPIINSKTRVAAVRAEVGNSTGLLKPEMFVQGSLQPKSKSGQGAVLIAPKSAVLWTGKRSVVYVKLPDSTVPSFQYREVELGEEQGANYQILSGLEAGEEVVTYGSFVIDAAAQLNNQRSMMNKRVRVKNEAVEVLPDYRAMTPTTFKQQFNGLVNAYILLKDAFVATDATAAALTGRTLLQDLDQIDMGLLKGDAHLYWMEQQKALKGHMAKIGVLKEVEAQRKQFGFLSDLLIDVIKVFGVEGEDLYVQHCPMAFDNEGGDWLSREETIKNPYFGNKMMKCGSVKATFSSEAN